MRTLVCSVAAVLLLATGAASAAEECSPAEAYAAEVVTDYLDDWPLIHRAYEEFGHCDDGAVAEGLSEAIVHVLAKRWTDLPRLQALAAEPRFRAFVLRHVDEAADPDELRKVEDLAARKCPKGARSLCQALQREAQKALRSIRQAP